MILRSRRQNNPHRTLSLGDAFRVQVLQKRNKKFSRQAGEVLKMGHLQLSTVALGLHRIPKGGPHLAVNKPLAHLLEGFFLASRCRFLRLRTRLWRPGAGTILLKFLTGLFELFTRLVDLRLDRSGLLPCQTRALLCADLPYNRNPLPAATS